MEKIFYNMLRGQELRHNEQGREATFYSSAKRSTTVVTFMIVLLMALCNVGAYAQSYSQPGDYTFIPADYGYGAAPEHNLSILNNTAATQMYEVFVSGADLTSFTVSPSGTAVSVTAGSSTVFTIKPNVGLEYRSTPYRTAVWVSVDGAAPVRLYAVEFTVNKKRITAEGITTTRGYNGGTNVNGFSIDISGAQLEGIVAGDVVTLDNSSASISSPPSKNVGEYGVLGSGFALSGADAGNYDLIQPTIAASITPRLISFTGITARKEYDGTPSFTGGQIDISVVTPTIYSLVPGDILTLERSGAVVNLATAGVQSALATTVTGFSLSGADAANYKLTQPSVTATIDMLTQATAAANVSNLLSLTPASSFTYNGTSRGITGVSAILSYLGTLTPTYRYTGTSNDGKPYASNDAPVNAGTYSIKVDVASSTNNFPLVLYPTFTISRANLTTGILVFDQGLDGAGKTVTYSYNGAPKSIAAPTLREPYTGLGAVTIRYNGSLTPPFEPGEYTVTAVIAQGANYNGATYSLGKLVINEQATTPIIQRKVTLNVSEHFTSDPAAGSFYIISGRDLVITLTPRASLPEGYKPTVTTNRHIIPDDKGGVNVTLNEEDGTYTVNIPYISEETVVTIEAVELSSGPNGNESAYDALRVWSYGRQLYIAAGANDGQAGIYNVSGVLLQTVPFVSGETHNITLPTGIYIVAAGKQIFKVVIKN
jgi:hypothetical protein